MAASPFPPDAPDFARRDINLADPRLGAEALAATDDFFADKQRLLSPQPAVFIPGKYDTNGKWMDGWESRRKRVAGHDWCLIRLGVPGQITGVDIDTSHFTGNYPPAASLEGCDGDPDDDAAWTPILPAVPLQGNSHHWHAVHHPGRFTHVRLHIYPDGGVARLRVYGRPSVALQGSEPVDLIAARHGGTVVAWNDAHFGVPHNLLMPGRGADMGDGWETRRRREPGHDWCILALGAPGIIEQVIVDTAHFKGNYPDACSIQAARMPADSTAQALVTQSMFWAELLAPHKLSMDHVHTFSDVAPLGAVTHVRFNIHPDGGVSRLRLIGRPA